MAAARQGNRRLKDACYLAAFASLGHAPSRPDYDRKRAEGKDHHDAIRCLARRRIDVRHARLPTGTPDHHHGEPVPPSDELPPPLPRAA
jgi:hypothetical protein